jgi:3-hydroxyisobutyrate dehydrogenase-like beta-hydroxyacid dehydrogenase
MFREIPQTHYVCAPVFGRPPAAMAGKLILCLGGDYTSQKNVAHLLIPAIGTKVLNLGGNVEKAASFKLVGNSFIVGSEHGSFDPRMPLLTSGSDGGARRNHDFCSEGGN